MPSIFRSSLARFTQIGALFVVLLLASAFTGAQADAGAGSADLLDDPEALRTRLLKHRTEEAEAKTARAAELLRGPQSRTVNQFDWDVHHYDIDITVDPGTHIVSGTVTTTAEVLVPSLTVFDLNLVATLSVTGATSGGSAATYGRVSNVVTVTLDRTYTTGETVVVELSYSGNPQGEAFGWSSFDGSDMIWTLSEPYGARSWWPCKDHNYDKADSLDIRVAVPDPLIVASNGLLQSATPSGGWTTYHWKTNYPTATYLVSLAIHAYTTFSHSYSPIGGGGPMPVDYYVFASHFSAVQATYALTVPMIEAFAAGYGEYPFVNEKYGHAEFTWGGGMEHQTLTSMGGYSEDLISHELAHQWWGDMVTCDTFNHIWLNEGFATWSEAYWKEQSDGFATYQNYMAAAAYFGAGTIYVEFPGFENIFDVNLSYNKGSWVPHMLRGVVGDTDFFAGLAHYRSVYGFDSATTEEFRDAMEFVSGKDLDAFFQQWIYGEYYPVYGFSWDETTPGEISLTINQLQMNTGLFTMPIDVRVTTSTGTFDFVVENSLASENYTLNVTGDITTVQLDPDNWILREVETFVTNPTFDAGILLVNGVDWASYDTEIRTAYADSVYWADLPFDFWDNFAEPGAGYPANLPTPLGHGSVPPEVLGSYSTVVWVGNNYNGDLPKWNETPIESYLDVGGNVLLLTRRGNTFLAGDLSTHLGVTWGSLQTTLANTTAVHPSFVDIGFTGTQSWNDLVSTTVGPNSTLVLQSVAGSTQGSGVIAEPPGGGTHRADGGKLAYIAGRSYRMNTTNLRDNVETILKDFFGEPYSSGAIDAPVVAASGGSLRLAPGVPNPFRSETRITFELPRAGAAEVVIFDVSGRRVRTLVGGIQPAGSHTVSWNGVDDRGHRAAAGVYFVRLSAGEEVRTRPVVRLR